MRDPHGGRRTHNFAFPIARTARRVIQGSVDCGLAADMRTATPCLLLRHVRWVDGLVDPPTRVAAALGWLADEPLRIPGEGAPPPGRRAKARQETKRSASAWQTLATYQPDLDLLGHALQ